MRGSDMLSYQDGDLIISGIRSRIHIEVHVVELSATIGSETAKRSRNCKAQSRNCPICSIILLDHDNGMPGYILILLPKRRDGQASRKTLGCLPSCLFEISKGGNSRSME